MDKGEKKKRIHTFRHPFLLSLDCNLVTFVTLPKKGYIAKKTSLKCLGMTIWRLTSLARVQLSKRSEIWRGVIRRTPPPMCFERVVNLIQKKEGKKVEKKTPPLARAKRTQQIGFKKASTFASDFAVGSCYMEKNLNFSLPDALISRKIRSII